MRLPRNAILRYDLADMPRVGEAGMRLLLVLLVLAAADGTVRERQGELATYAGVSRSTLREALARLRDAGVIEFDGARGRTTEYRVMSRWLSDMAGGPAISQKAEGADMAGGPAISTPDMAGGPAISARPSYRDRPRARVQDQNLPKTASNNRSKKVTTPPVLGGSGVATPEDTRRDNRQPDNVTYLRLPAAHATDNTTAQVIR